MDLNEFVALWWYLRRRNRAKRKHWVQPIVQERFSLGIYDNLMAEMRNDEPKFLEYFRMSASTFDDLLARITPEITVRDTKFRECICPEQRLAICLRYFVTGCSFKDLHLEFRVGISTVSKIIKEISHIIWNILSTDFLNLPETENEWEDIACRFESKTDFPHCIGVVDLKHFRLVKPPKSRAKRAKLANSATNNTENGVPGVIRYPRKRIYNSLLAVVDAEYRFMYVEVGSYGDECDSNILKNSPFWQRFNDGSLNLPKPRHLHDEWHEELPFVLVGDEAFTTTPNVLRPYGGPQMDEKKYIFNYRLNRARIFIERAFDILTTKWRVLYHAIDLHTETAIEVIKACTVLHNFVKEKDEIDYDNEVVAATEKPKQKRRPNKSLRGGPNAIAVRRAFSDYFMSDIGSIPGQAILFEENL